MSVIFPPIVDVCCFYNESYLSFDNKIQRMSEVR